MMGWLAAAGAILSIAGGISAKKDAKRAARTEQALEGQVTTEKLRQMTYEEQVERGGITAQYSNSGADVNVGSPLDVLTEQAAEYKRLRSSVAETGATRSAAAGLRGDMVGRQAVYSGLGDALGWLSRIDYSGIGKAKTTTNTPAGTSAPSP